MWRPKCCVPVAAKQDQNAERKAALWGNACLSKVTTKAYQEEYQSLARNVKTNQARGGGVRPVNVSEDAGITKRAKLWLPPWPVARFTIVMLELLLGRRQNSAQADTRPGMKNRNCARGISFILDPENAVETGRASSSDDRKDYTERERVPTHPFAFHRMALRLSSHDLGDTSGMFGDHST